MAAVNRNKPTQSNQLWCVDRLMENEGIEGVFNPYGMIGLTCGCGTCFCCIALKKVVQIDPKMVQAYQEEEVQDYEPDNC